MSKYERIKGHLPSLYQPEARDETLFNALLQELGASMDEVSRDLTEVMQAHWYTVADKATFDKHFLRARLLAGQLPVNLQDPKDLKAIALYPYLLDLARIGALMGIRPWWEPSNLRETVEAYRKRLLRIVNIYRNGLGTLGAVRSMVTAELPENLELPLAALQRSFSIEENVPYTGDVHAIQSLGLPIDILGPLMRWQLSNTGLKAVAPILYVEGIAPTTEHDATVFPVIERFDVDGNIDPFSQLVGIGIGYKGTLAPGQTLKLSPAHQMLLIREGALMASSIVPEQVSVANWLVISGTPEGTMTQLLRTTDGYIWVAILDEEEQQLWRFNGASWVRVLGSEVLPAIHCLYQSGQKLLIGCEEGLLSMDIYPLVEGNYVATPVATLLSNPVYAIEAVGKNALEVYVATQNGLMTLDNDGAISSIILPDTPVRAVAETDTGIYIGGDIGLFYFKTVSNALYYCRADLESELEDDWEIVNPASLPDGNGFGLPMVLSLLASHDETLWIGTEAGLARYRSRKEADLVHRTLLEAFAELFVGSVQYIVQDEHGLVWFATPVGLLRYDGRDMARYEPSTMMWQQLGQADMIYRDEKSSPRGLWRYDRDGSAWETFDYTSLQWTTYNKPPLLVEANDVTKMLFIDRVLAELGSLTGEDFVKDSDVPSTELVMRCKPEPTRIVDGGIPFVPRMPKGNSSWRYLSLEPDDLVDSTDLPWWSIEGRLVPPPDHEPPYPGRFHILNLKPFQLEQMVFAYNPAAKINCQWASNKPLRLLVRLFRRNDTDVIDPAILDRVWQGILKVRPAGVLVQLAVEDKIVRGETS